MGRRGPGQRWDRSSHTNMVLLGGLVYIPCSTLATPEPRRLQQSSKQHGCRRQPPASWAQQGWELPGTTAERGVRQPALSPSEGGSLATTAT